MVIHRGACASGCMRNKVEALIFVSNTEHHTMEVTGFRWELCVATRTPLLVRVSSPSYVLDGGVVKVVDGETTPGTPPCRTTRELDCSPLTQPELLSSPPAERVHRQRALSLLSTLEGLAAMDNAAAVLATLTPCEIARITAAMRVLLDTCRSNVDDATETSMERSPSFCPSSLPDWLAVAEKLLRVQA